ncbi:unnamed protein product [Echinostoma caproni]|uniref:Nucleoporin Nup98 n=1 Tax=Echinostoma caproni TaxID=27848 RepID=A0A183A1U3_9TREM|nr:unnamed protein product [Echinostoma caproni]
MFGAAKTAFGSPASSGFGQSGTTLFGAAPAQANQPTNNLFGQSAMSLSASTFGSTAQAGTIGWGASADASQSPNGTSIAFNPPSTTDSVLRGGQSTTVNAKHMCITAMKEYQFKSLEPATSGTSIFGQPNKPTNTLFGGGNLMFGSSSPAAPTAFGRTPQTQGELVSYCAFLDCFFIRVTSYRTASQHTGMLLISVCHY